MRFTILPLLEVAALLLSAITISSAEDTKKCAADYFVKELPGQPPGPLIKMHAGHIEVDHDNNGHLFFWHFQNKHIAQRQRTVIWLNGGPGCSSLDGALMEIGPYRLKDDHTLIENEGSWHEFANVLFVDQPVGTGFSYVNTDHYLHELGQMADHFVIFMTKFFELFPEYEDDDIYFAGESYAGQHIPYIADAVLRRNANKPRGAQDWHIKGLIIGNGWIDPEPQYLAYATYAYKHNILSKTSDAGKAIEAQVAICQKDLAAGGKNHVDTTSCESILNEILKRTKLPDPDHPGNSLCYNMYDIRLMDSFPSCGMNWPPDLTSVTPYLRRSDVVAALHINHDKMSGWQECSGAVSSSFKAYKSAPSVTLLPHILETIPVVLFSGDQDLICNHIGTEDLINNLSWNGGKGFELSAGQWAPREEWSFEGQPAGIYQTARNLTYVLFYNSSHMVPFDVSRRSRDMLDRFMKVDIASIGGHPSDSLISGQKGPLVAVGSHPNSTIAMEQEKARLQAARWDAYYRSGVIALIVVATLAVAWGMFVFRSRQKARRGRMGYKGVAGEDGREWDEGNLEELAPRRGRYEVGDESDGEESPAQTPAGK
ncbi:pheromone-processing carboxypeptidase KEX1 [Pyronema domesticum]|uniref:Pheromone-processing carboxypeptidase KEX1 n=1 Tax=Pyronema omphalodes (strain CBS 100304) TaxID=1076935 RepID=U4KVC0_PYROM|nr:pheromone-processing carboxypeptidase KEX1 [Pyronema domesticum]CCX04846.1 Similar to Pheromone-processing carboxypeptidase KEX1; acc. no. D5G4B1 [Pyronema omphalodes CBS 100304]